MKSLKVVLLGLVGFLFSTAVFFLLSAFIYCTFDFTRWPHHVRKGLSILVLFFFIMTILIVGNVLDTTEKKK